MRAVVALSLAGAVPATLGGLVFWAVASGTSISRSIAFGFWIAAAVMLGLMFVSGRKIVWRCTSLPVPEGWVFVGAAVVLTVVGAGIDAA